MRRLPLAILTAAGLGAAPATATAGGEPVTIDDFGSSDATVVLAGPANPVDNRKLSWATGAGSMLGGYRKLGVLLYEAAGAQTTATIAGGTLTFGHDDTASSGVVLTWDGSEQTGGVYNRLGDHDLTVGGTQDALDLSLLESTRPLNLINRLFSQYPDGSFADGSLELSIPATTIPARALIPYGLHTSGLGNDSGVRAFGSVAALT